MRWFRCSTGVALAAALAVASPAHADKVRIGYWTSGVSVGFGAVLESQPFLKQAGVDAEFVRFSDVNGPTRALAANVIDLAFGGAAAAVFSTIREGVPISIFLATQPADVQFVAPVDSPIKTMVDLRGKKVGMSPAGSSVAAIAQAILAANYGIKPADFALVGGNESRLAQFLVQKQVDAAALRSVTIAQLQELKLRKLGGFIEEWKKLTKSDAMPYIGIGTVRTEVLEKHPETVAKVIVAMRNALAWGEAHPADVAAILQKVANLPAADAKAYAGLWNTMNRAALEPADISSLKREQQLLVDAGAIKGALPDAAFAAGPYKQSKSLK
ncbi:MAG: aliphatic sulfonate ABC transporter substrate-binding protein [Bradyrhizobium sp.]